MKFPDKINIESSTNCNARCVFCPRDTMIRPKGSMSDELFHKIIKEGKEMGVKNYSPFFMGEPFVFPKIWEWLDYMEKEGVGVGLYTNGQFIDVERVIKYKNIRYLNFSINALTAETHRKVMRGPKFEKVMENYKKARMLAPFYVRKSFVVHELNVHEVKEFESQRGSEVVGFYDWTGDKYSVLARKGEKGPCWVLFHQMTILWDGRVVPCCADYNGKLILGDVSKQSLREVWLNTEWLREKHRKMEFDTSPCDTCNYNTKNRR